MPLGTRAVSLVIPPGAEPSEPCPACDERVKYTSKIRKRKVICNLYATPADHVRYERRRIEGNHNIQAPALPPGVDGVWDRVEEWHAECYEAAGFPHGFPAERKAPQTAGRRVKGDDLDLAV